MLQLLQRCTRVLLPRRRSRCSLKERQESMNSRRAVVTGGAGFLGSHLCDALLAENWTVIVVDNLLTGRRANFAHLNPEPRFEFVEKDICEPFDVGKVDYVFHFASPASPVDYSIHGIPTLKVGSLGTFHALDLAHKYGAKYLVSSTTEHLLSTFYSMGIDNAFVEIDNLEVPILDGSGQPFVELIREAGIRQYRRKRKYLRIRRPIFVEERGKRISILPAESFCLTCETDYGHPLAGRRSIEMEVTPERYAT